METPSAQASIPTPTDRCCEHCGRASTVLVEMEPGRGSVWWLCTRCWIDGVRKMADNGPANAEPKRGPVVDPEMADALKKSGWKVTDARPSDKPVKRKRKVG